MLKTNRKSGRFLKFFAVVCTMCLMASLVSVTIVAADNGIISISSGMAEKGKTVSVSVNMVKNPGISEMKLRLHYDSSVLTLEAVSIGTVFEANELTPSQSLNKNPYVIVCSSGDMVNKLNNSKTGNIVTLNFKVGENAEYKEHAITVEIQAVNIEGKKCSFDAENGSVSVVKCIHSKEWRVTSTAACEKDGIESLICTKCSEVFETKSISAYRHKNTEIRNAKAVTVNAEGYTGDTYCKDCGKLISKGEIIAKLKSDETTSSADDDMESGNTGVTECMHLKEWRVTSAAVCEKDGTESLVCTKCSEVFGTRSISAYKHKNTEVRNAKVATASNEGYTGDTYCKDCGKLISRGKAIEKLTIGISPSTSIASSSSDLPELDESESSNSNDNGYDITKGKKSLFDKSSKKSLTFVSNADFSEFVRVEIDGKTLDETSYTVEKGSTIITVSSDFLSTLSNGTHTISIVSKSGTASTEFTVEGTADTSSDETDISSEVPDLGKTEKSSKTAVVVIVVIFVLAVGAVGTVYFFKQRRG